MKTKELDYKYPKELVAQHPSNPRDAARLLVLDKKRGKLEHSTFKDILGYLKKGDVLVFNKTKVFPARITANKDTGGKVEVVFLREFKSGVWEVIIGGKVRDGQKLNFPGGLTAFVEKNKEGKYIKLELTGKEVLEFLKEHGKIPLPPYIKRASGSNDKKDYQTVFASIVGSAAAPTAGLHFTKSLLVEIKKAGVEVEYVTLHVGLGTFQPVATKKVEEHPIHSEYYSIAKETAKKINAAKKEGRRIIAVGTTVVRTLESAGSTGRVLAQDGNTGLFIYPGFKFKIVDGLITNFHTPKSSLLALVYAFAGKGKIKKAYREAIKKKYRLFSYGDGMFIK